MLVRLNSTLRGESGVRDVSIDLPAGGTVEQVLWLVVAQDPRVRLVLLDSAGALRQNLVVFRNGSNVRLLDGLNTPVAGTDKLDLFPLTGAQRAFAY